MESVSHLLYANGGFHSKGGTITGLYKESRTLAESGFFRLIAIG